MVPHLFEQTEAQDSDKLCVLVSSQAATRSMGCQLRNDPPGRVPEFLVFKRHCNVGLLVMPRVPRVPRTAGALGQPGRNVPWLAYCLAGCFLAGAAQLSVRHLDETARKQLLGKLTNLPS